MEVIDTSHDNSLDIIDCDDFKIDFNSLMEDVVESPRKQTRPMGGSFEQLPSLSNTPKLTLNDNSVTNDLFQVTRNAISPPRKKNKKAQQVDLFTEDDVELDDLFATKRLNNNKIEKLVHDLESNDFEMDDQVRTRIFKGRFNHHHQNEVDDKLGSYLDDKENQVPYPDPLKSVRNKENNSIKKSKRRPLVGASTGQGSSTGGLNSSVKSFIPTLKPLTNISTNYIDLRNDRPTSREYYPLRKSVGSLQTSPKRINAPNHLKYLNEAIRPVMKYNDKQTNIYIVDSLTGLINDATQFGTELNASNCEGFPLPEDVNEIVQIPTNDDINKNKQKMAIIKAYHNKYTKPKNNKNNKNDNKSNIEKGRTGYYTNEEFQKFLINKRQPDVEVLQTQNSLSNKRDIQRVKWADQLEW